MLIFYNIKSKSQGSIAITESSFHLTYFIFVPNKLEIFRCKLLSIFSYFISVTFVSFNIFQVSLDIAMFSEALQLLGICSLL